MKLNLLTREDLGDPETYVTVSPSQMSMWYRCRYAWKLAKIDGVGQENYRESGAANKGLIFHAFMDWLHKHCIGRPISRLSPTGQKQALEHVQLTYGADADFYKVFTIFLAYVDWAAENEEGIPIASEIEVFADTGLVTRDGRKIYLHGFIDLLLDLFGKLILIDHKSHTNQPWTKSRLFYDHQFMFYWLLLELNGVQVDGAFVNAVNLFIPVDEKKFDMRLVGIGTKNVRPRFERIPLGPHEVNLQFYLDEFLKNIKQMWCDEPSYPMRLSSDCAYCTFRDHIELDATGNQSASIATLKVRHNTSDFELVDDSDDDAA